MRRGRHRERSNKKWREAIIRTEPTSSENNKELLLLFQPTCTSATRTWYSNNNNNNNTGSSMSPDPEPLVQLAFSELTLGRILGQGGFSVVSEITSIDLDDAYDTNEAETKARKDFSRLVNSGSSSSSSSSSSSLQQHQQTNNNNKYVLKMLRTDLPVEEHLKGVVDLKIEADFLRVLQHPNIIRMRATANTDPHENRFFVILDRLGMTLDRKFNYWRKLVGANSGYWFPVCGCYCCANAPALHAVWKERMETALDIAKAIQYLHSQKIVYRDLKPDNIGYDSMTGRHVKIFDFGLAKRLQDAESAGEGLYLLTGNTGSLRYMSPEVALDKPYNQSVDAYSFGILFWQICALQTPFAGFSERSHAEKVVRCGHRPKPDRSWPGSWIQLMTDCWNQDYQLRPDFDRVVQDLDDRLSEMEEEDGVVPSRASDIRAKKRKKKAKDQKLDVDTRLATTVDGSRRPDGDIV